MVFTIVNSTEFIFRKYKNMKRPSGTLRLISWWRVTFTCSYWHLPFPPSPPLFLFYSCFGTMETHFQSCKILFPLTHGKHHWPAVEYLWLSLDSWSDTSPDDPCDPAWRTLSSRLPSMPWSLFIIEKLLYLAILEIRIHNGEDIVMNSASVTQLWWF